MNENYTSSELFHFVGFKDPKNHQENYKTLRNVLNSKCVAYSPDDLSWGPVQHTVDWSKSILDEELVVPTITCYADIPKHALTVHMKKYGCFGLSIDREYLIRFHARPVIYIPIYDGDHLGISGRTLIRDIESSARGLNDLTNHESQNEHSRGLGSIPADANEAIRALRATFLKDFIGFIKPFNSELNTNDKKNYYLEREWRKLGNIKFEEDVVHTVVIAKEFKEEFLGEFPTFEEKLKVVDPEEFL